MGETALKTTDLWRASRVIMRRQGLKEALTYSRHFNELGFVTVERFAHLWFGNGGFK
jgi:hypothetical protein